MHAEGEHRAYAEEREDGDITVFVKRRKEVDNSLVMAEVHFLARGAEGGNSEKHKSYAKKKIAYVAVLTCIDKQQCDEECWEHKVRHIKREAQRHDPCCKRGANVGAHNYRDGLCQCEQSGVHKRYGHYRRSCRRLHGGRYKHTGQQTSEAVGGHGSKDMAQLRARHLL